jgi:hypothetical protein
MIRKLADGRFRLYSRKKSAHRKAPKPRNVPYKTGGAAARACGSVFQTALNAKAVIPQP